MRHFGAAGFMKSHLTFNPHSDVRYKNDKVIQTHNALALAISLNN